MTASTHAITASTAARRITAVVSVAALTLATLAGCERRQSDVPATTPSSPTTTTPSTGTGTGTGGSTGSGPGSMGTAPMPGGAASDPMAPSAPASAASS